MVTELLRADLCCELGWLWSTSVPLVLLLRLGARMLGAEAMSRCLELILNGNLFVSENKFYLNKSINTLDQTPVTGTCQGTRQLLVVGCSSKAGYRTDNQFEMCSLIRSLTLPGWRHVLGFLVWTSLS